MGQRARQTDDKEGKRNDNDDDEEEGRRSKRMMLMMAVTMTAVVGKACVCGCSHDTGRLLVL